MLIYRCATFNHTEEAQRTQSRDKYPFISFSAKDFRSSGNFGSPGGRIYERLPDFVFSVPPLCSLRLKKVAHGVIYSNID